MKRSSETIHLQQEAYLFHFFYESKIRSERLEKAANDKSVFKCRKIQTNSFERLVI